MIRINERISFLSWEEGKGREKVRFEIDVIEYSLKQSYDHCCMLVLEREKARKRVWF